MKAVKRYVIFTGLTSLLLGLVASALLPSKVLAAGESYLWQTSTVNGQTTNQIVGSGGEFAKFSGQIKVFGQVNQTPVYEANRIANTLPGCGSALQPKYTITLTAPDKGTVATENRGCASTPQINGAITIAGASPTGGFPAPGTAPAAGTNLCNEQGGDLGWLACPVMLWITDGMQKMSEFITDRLKLDTCMIFNVPDTSGAVCDASQAESSAAYKKTWTVFRNLAYALLIIFALIMVVSQVAGLELFDAYTIRKMLPKLIAAVIGVALSWEIMELLYRMSNDAADAVMSLIRTPFEQVGGVRDAIAAHGYDNLMVAVVVRWLQVIGLLSGATVAVIAFAQLGGAGVIASLIASAGLFIFSFFLLLAARGIIATLLVIAMPVLIMLAVSDATKKAFSFGRGIGLTLLISVPGVGAVLTATNVAALISLAAGGAMNAITAFLFLIGGIALVWGLFLKLDTITGYLGNVASKVTGRMQKGLSNYRANALKNRFQQGVAGERSFKGPAGAIIGATQRAKWAGQPGNSATSLLTQKGRAGYNEYIKNMRKQAREEAVKRGGYASGNTDANMVLKDAKNDAEFLRRYAQMQMDEGATAEVARSRALAALGAAKTAYGAEVGSATMQSTAFQALMQDNTSYRHLRDRSGRLIKDANGKKIEMSYGQMAEAVYGDAADMVKRGILDTADAAGLVKSNGARADRAGLGFGATIGVIDDIARNGTQQVLTAQKLNEMADEVIKGTGPGQMLGQRHEAVRILAPEMQRRAQEAFDAGLQNNDALSDGFVRQIAAAMGRRDMAGQLPELNADEFVAGQGNQQVGGKNLSEWEEFLRGRVTPSDPVYQAIVQQNYANAAVANGQTRAQADQMAKLASGQMATYSNTYAQSKQQGQTDAQAAQAAYQASGMDADTFRQLQSSASTSIQQALTTIEKYRREYGSAWQQQMAGRDPSANPGQQGIPGGP